MLTKNALLLAAAALGIGAATNASAFALPGETKVEFDFNVVDASTLGYPVGAVPGNPVCVGVAACDAAAAAPAPGAVGSEDTWGVGNIQAITDRDTLTTLWSSSAAERLTTMFYGITDETVEWLGADGAGVNTWRALGVGGIVDIYLRPGAEVDITGGPAARTGLDSYPTATDGELFLRLALSPGVIFGDNVHTFFSEFTDGAVASQGQGFLDVIGGSYAWLFDTDTLQDPNGNFHDFQFDVTVSSQGAPSNWIVRGQGQMVGETVPTPATLLLLSTGLIGFARFFRSR